MILYIKGNLWFFSAVFKTLRKEDFTEYLHNLKKEDLRNLKKRRPLKLVERKPLQLEERDFCNLKRETFAA